MGFLMMPAHGTVKNAYYEAPAHNFSAHSFSAHSFSAHSFFAVKALASDPLVWARASSGPRVLGSGPEHRLGIAGHEGRLHWAKPFEYNFYLMLK